MRWDVKTPADLTDFHQIFIFLVERTSSVSSVINSAVYGAHESFISQHDSCALSRHFQQIVAHTQS
jgi:hypothetical protein